VAALLFAAFARVRLFIMFHDCTHNAMFGTTADGGEFSLNERVGTVCQPTRNLPVACDLQVFSERLLAIAGWRRTGSRRHVMKWRARS
jgi:hypothetical protein